MRNMRLVSIGPGSSRVRSFGEATSKTPKVIQAKEDLKVLDIERLTDEIVKEKVVASLNLDLNFDNFVEGKSNQLAKAACVSVVKELGQYNPLYIYGGVGLGKTHLLHSIGNAIIAENPQKKVVYLHSEKFVQNMVTALRQNKIEEFKNFYRK